MRRLLSAGACLALAAMSFDIAAPTPVLAASAPETQQAVLPAEAGKGKPFGPAKAKPKPTEIPARRTAYSNSYDNHDGTLTAVVATGPINYLPVGSHVYQPIDTTLEAIPGKDGRVRASKMATPVEVGSPTDGSGFLSMDTGKGVVRLRLAPGASAGKPDSKPSTGGSQADVLGLMPNVDFRANIDNTGVSTYFVLAARPSSPSFTLELDTGGLTAALQPDGQVYLLDAAGKMAAYMPAPYATDSQFDLDRGSCDITYKVAYSLESRGSKTLLTVTVDEAWLAAAMYPVYVDPTIVSGTSLVNNNTVSETNYNQVYQYITNSPYKEFLTGYDGASHWNAYLRFDLEGAGIPPSYVTNATLTLHPYHQWYPTNRQTSVAAVTSSWSPTNLKWSNAPFHSTPWPTALLTFNSDKGVTKDVTLPNSLVQGWVSDADSNYGLYLYGRHNTSGDWKRFIASQDTTGKQKPQLSVTWALPGVSTVSPTGSQWTNSRTLSWEYDPLSGAPQAEYQVQVATDSAFTSPAYDSGETQGTGETADIWSCPGFVDT